MSGVSGASETSAVRGSEPGNVAAEDGGKPPDGGGEPHKKISFRDKVLGGNSVPKQTLPDDLLGNKLAKIETNEGDKLRPRITFDKSVIDVISAPWRDALVIKLLGRNLGYSMIKGRLKNLWRLQGGYEILLAGFGYFMVKFDSVEDREKVMTGGPWMIQGCYLAVKRWTPDFNLCDPCFGRTIIWVRFSGLNAMYYHSSALRTIASAIGRPVRFDVVTEEVERANFARVCVEVDLTSPMIKEIWIKDHWHLVEYENLHLICSSCNCYGHVTRDCTKVDKTKRSADGGVAQDVARACSAAKVSGDVTHLEGDQIQI